MLLIILLRDMKWTWQELQEQPQWVINNLLAYIQEEAIYQSKQK